MNLYLCYKTVNNWCVIDDEPEEPPSWVIHAWEEVEEIWQYLQNEERIILACLRTGKTPTEIAEFFNLPSRQLADKEMRRAVEVARFYIKWKLLLQQLPLDDFSLERAEILKRFILFRQSYVEIAKYLKIEKFELVYKLRFLVDHLQNRGYVEVAQLLQETWSNRRLRVTTKGAMGNRIEWKGKRRAMMPEPWRYDLRNLLVDLVGKVDYEWGGQAIDWKKGEGRADCSGLAIEVLKKVGKLPVNFRDTDAQGLLNYFNKWTTKPSMGDLAFYGKGVTGITHVMFFLGYGALKIAGLEELNKKELVIGMCEGAVGMKAEEARLLGAGLHVRYSPRYRKDFVGYKVVS